MNAPLQRKRRTKEEIAAAESCKRSIFETISALVSEHCDDMSEAEANPDGYRVTTLNIGIPTTSDGKAFVGIEYRPQIVRASNLFTLDNGQSDLPLQPQTNGTSEASN